jgi:hypothetical protein
VFLDLRYDLRIGHDHRLLVIDPNPYFVVHITL